MSASTLATVLRRIMTLFLLALLVGSTSGCSLFVMAGKMLFGDPKIPAAFRAQTGVDLTESEHTLLVMCRSPHLILSQAPTFEFDLTDGILRRLKQQEIKVVSPDKVSRWLDRNGGEFEDVSELAEDFDADFIAIVDIQQVRFYEENSRDMLRGHAQGTVRVHKKGSIGGEKTAFQVFSNGFSIDYPRFRPVSIHEMSERVFQKQFVDNLSRQLARQFHDYSAADEF